MDALSERERDVLALMAEGRSNAGIARTVEKHVRSILAKLNLPEAEEDHRRVLAVITFLQAQKLSHLYPLASRIGQVADPLAR